LADWVSRGRVAASCIATAAAVACGAGATAAPASRSSAVQVLTYVDASSRELCGMRADGSHRVRLLRSGLPIGTPAWSADGRYVALAGATHGEEAILVADARGRVRWHFGLGKSLNVWGPLWAPDGQHIAYYWSSAYGRGFAVARADGSKNHEIAPNVPGAWPPDEIYPPVAWTADGQHLAFADRAPITDPQGGGIYSVNVDDESDRRLLVAGASEPAFSPDGSKLAYLAFSDGGRFEGVYIAAADGSNPRVLAVSTDAFTAPLLTPTWSPDGQSIAFLRGNGNHDGGFTSARIVVVDADGSNERVIALSARPDLDLRTFAWSPDSKLIAFTRGRFAPVGNRPFTSLIVVARADGGGTRVILRRRGKVGLQEPAWRPAIPLPSANRLPC
jgi:Tol biopolymer transport system component